MSKKLETRFSLQKDDQLQKGGSRVGVAKNQNGSKKRFCREHVSSQIVGEISTPTFSLLLLRPVTFLQIAQILEIVRSESQFNILCVRMCKAKATSCFTSKTWANTASCTTQLAAKEPVVEGRLQGFGIALKPIVHLAYADGFYISIICGITRCLLRRGLWNLRAPRLTKSFSCQGTNQLPVPVSSQVIKIKHQNQVKHNNISQCSGQTFKSKDCIKPSTVYQLTQFSFQVAGSPPPPQSESWPSRVFLFNDRSMSSVIFLFLTSFYTIYSNI